MRLSILMSLLSMSLSVTAQCVGNLERFNDVLLEEAAGVQFEIIGDTLIQQSPYGKLYLPMHNVRIDTAVVPTRPSLLITCADGQSCMRMICRADTARTTATNFAVVQFDYLTTPREIPCRAEHLQAIIERYRNLDRIQPSLPATGSIGAHRTRTVRATGAFERSLKLFATRYGAARKHKNISDLRLELIRAQMQLSTYAPLCEDAVDAALKGLLVARRQSNATATDRFELALYYATQNLESYRRMGGAALSDAQLLSMDKEELLTHIDLQLAQIAAIGRASKALVEVW